MRVEPGLCLERPPAGGKLEGSPPTGEITEARVHGTTKPKAVDGMASLVMERNRNFKSVKVKW